MKSRILNIIIFMLERNKISKMSRCYYIFLKKLIVNESRFLNVNNRIHNCQSDDSETIKKKSTFSKT
jgi:hypothetical protein